MDWLSEHGWAGWLAAAGLLAVAEMFSLDLILAMLAVGALAGMVADLLGAPFVLSGLLAAVTAVAMLAFVRPSVARRLHRGPELTLGHAKLVGQGGVVTQAMTTTQTGRIMIGGEEWSAAPTGETAAIAVGEHVEVRAIRGATAYVAPLPYRPS